MIKRLTALFLSLLLLLCALPAVVFAEDEVNYNLWVGGVRVTSTNKSGDGWKYEGDDKAGTLTLSGASITGTYRDSIRTLSYAVYADGMDLTINLSGKNTINVKNVNNANGIVVRGGNLTIEGNGSIDIFASDYGIRTYGSLLLNNTNIKIDSTYGGIYEEQHDININGGKVDISASDNGIDCYGFNMKNDAQLTINAGYYGLETFYVFITDSTADITSREYAGLYINSNERSGNIEIKNSTVNVTTTRNNTGAVNTNSHNLILTDSILTVEGSGTAINTKAIEILSEDGSISTILDARRTNASNTHPAILVSDENSISLGEDFAIVEPELGEVGQQPNSEKYTVLNKDGEAASHVIIKQTRFNVKLAETKNGTATVSATKAAQGDEITVKAEPARGYELDSITYTDAGKKTVDITKTGKFKMPNSNVTVAVTFKEIKKEVTPTPAPAAEKTYDQIMASMTAKGKKALTLKWNKIADAEGYDIFFAKCNSNKKKEVCKLVKTVSAGKSSWTKNKLKAKTSYKAYVRAFVMKDGAKTYISKSPDVHAYTSGGNAKYTNPKSVTVKKKTVTLKTGKTYKIKASVKKLKNSKKLISKGHAAKLRYLSSDTGVATVTKNGKIKAIKAGTCKIYVYAVNGVSKTVKLTVK